MDVQATAEALVPEVTVSEPAVTSEAEAEPDYGAVYDKLTAEDPVDTPAEAESESAEAADTPAEAETVAEVVEAPTDAPAAVRKHWNEIPEEARDAVLASQREMSRKLSDMGRQMQGISPIRDVLVSAVKELPALGNMRPEDVAQEVVTLAKISADFRTKPLETFLSLAKQHNMTDALRQALGGQQQSAETTAATQAEIRALKEHIARIADPEFIQQQVEEASHRREVIQSIPAWTEGLTHYAEVEGYLPGIIKLVQQASPESPPKDVLKTAYETALSLYRPDLKAPAKAAVEAAETPDPERAKAAIQAKSVNVPGQTAGKPRQLTESEAYDAAWERAQRK